LVCFILLIPLPLFLSFPFFSFFSFIHNISPRSNVSTLVDRYAEANPNSAYEMIVRGEVALEGANDRAKATEYFELALSRDSACLEAASFLGRIFYEQNEYEKAIERLKRFLTVEMESTTNVGHVVAVLKGLFCLSLCHEKLGSRPNQIECLHRLVSSAIVMKIPNENIPVELIESAMRSVPFLYLESGDVPSCIRIFRSCLLSSFPFTHQTRQSLFLGLAQVLLYKACDEQYPPMDTKLRKQSDAYIPTNLTDEAILSLLATEGLLSSGGNQKQTKDVIFGLTLAYAQQANFLPIANLYEKTLPSLPQWRHGTPWLIYAISLIQANQAKDALFAYQQCIDHDPDDPMPYLFAVKVIVNSLPTSFELGIHLARSAIGILLRKVTEPKGQITPPRQNLIAKAYHLLGLCYYHAALHENSTKQKSEAQLLALESLHRAHQISCHDATILLHLALQYAEIRDLKKSLRFILTALRITKHNDQLWVLFVLVLSAQQFHDKAMDACDAALVHFPDHLVLLHLKAKLYQVRNDPNRALSCLLQAMTVFRQQADTSSETCDDVSDVRSADDGFTREAPPQQEVKKKNRKMTAYDGGDGPIGDTALVRFFATPNCGFELLGLSAFFDDKKRKKTQFWLDAVAFYLHCQDSANAQSCLREAHKVCPYHPDVMFYKAKFAEMEGKGFNELVRLFDLVLLVDSNHTETKMSLASLYLAQGNRAVAENHLTSVVRHAPTCHKAWAMLGTLFLHSKDVQRASECFATALQLEATAPVRPFSTVNVSM
jgi:tetratricopeptide (TPR) repeat protein